MSTSTSATSLHATDTSITEATANAAAIASQASIEATERIKSMSGSEKEQEVNEVDVSSVQNEQEVNEVDVSSVQNEQEVNEVDVSAVQNEHTKLPQMPEKPVEEPMPSEEECLLKHIGTKLHSMLHAQSKEAIKTFEAEYSPNGLAVDTELAQRAMRPHMQSLQMMQSYAKMLKTKAEKKQLENSYAGCLRLYNEANAEFSAKQEELRSTVRKFVYDELDKAQQAQLTKYRNCKPLSKGRRKHFWEAVSTDNVEKFKQTIETIDDVQCAVHSIQHTAHPDDPKLSLLCAFVQQHRSVPANGAHQTLGVLLTKFNSFFTPIDIQNAMQFITDNGCEESHAACLDVLTNALA